MRLRKIAAAMLAAVMLGSSAVYTAGAADTATVADAEQPGLSAPKNLRYENGDIKWDKVEDAYGYILRVSDGEREWEREHNFTDDDDLFVEFDRLCYEEKIPLGTYTVKMRAFDASGEYSQWTASVTAEYAATLSAPGNVRLSEDEDETVLWDDVDGAYRYNIHITNENGYISSTYTNGTCLGYYWYCGETGVYSFSVQSIDKDYNVSEWRSLNITHTQVERVHLDAPQNIRFDESGENVLWDAVDGADAYTVVISTCATDENGNNIYEYEYAYPTEPRFDNWKSIAALFPNAEYQIYVYAYKNDVDYENETSEALEATYAIEQDTTIDMPENIQAEGSYLKWDAVDNADTYWVNILMNGKPVYDCCHSNKAEENTEQGRCYIYSLDYLPAEDYDVELYVVDKDGGYNKKTYSMKLGLSPDESVWVPKVYSKGNILWDYDRFRHDDTEGFWVRVKNAKDDTVVTLDRLWDEYYYGWLDLPNGEYTVEVCAVVNDQTDWEYKVGNWSKLLSISKHGDSGFDKENEKTTEVEIPPEAAEIPEADRITSITINPAFNMKHKDGDDVELDLSKIEIKAKEIYAEEDLKRVEEALGKEIVGNKHYNLLDLTLLYNGEDFSNGYEGLVQVIIPLPAGHRDKTFSCYRMTEVDGKMTKEVIPGEQTEDSYIIYLEHFSLYALVADGGEAAPIESDPESSETTDSTDSSESSDASDTTTSDTIGDGDQQPTGIALAIVPVILAASVAAVVIIKKKK